MPVMVSYSFSETTSLCLSLSLSVCLSVSLCVSLSVWRVRRGFNARRNDDNKVPKIRILTLPLGGPYLSSRPLRAVAARPGCMTKRGNRRPLWPWSSTSSLALQPGAQVTAGFKLRLERILPSCTWRAEVVTTHFANACGVQILRNKLIASPIGSEND